MVRLSLLALSTALAAFTQTQVASLEHVTVDQAVTALPGMKIYFDARGADGAELANLAPESVDVQVEGKPVKLTGLKPFAQTGEGVAYVFLVDISKSVSPALFNSIKKEMQEFFARLTPADRAAIITFGDDTQIATRFTADQKALSAAAAGMSPTALTTHLNLGLRDGLRLARRLDANLPQRRAIIILSDGKDEGSGLTTEDILHENEVNRIPIYSVGASDLPRSERRQYLDVLQRYSLLSGGAYYEIANNKTGGVYGRIHDRITQVWEATLDCPNCPSDGRPYPLQVKVTVGGSVLAEKLSVSFSKEQAAATTGTPAKASNGEAPVRRRINWWIYGGAGAALMLVVALVAFLMLRRRREPEPIPEVVQTEPVAIASSLEPEVIHHYVAPDTRPGLQLEFTRRVGHGTGGSYHSKLVNRLVLGRAQDAGLRLPDTEISAQHCAFELVDGRVMVTDLGSTYGTAVNGVPINGRQRIESGDSISLGPVEFRVRIES